MSAIEKAMRLAAQEHAGLRIDCVFISIIQWMSMVSYKGQWSGEFFSTYPGDFQQARLDPLPSVFKTSAAVAVHAAQEGATHAARYAVIVGSGVDGH